MFTSEPSLSQRIERKIRETPIVDAHSRVSCDHPQASDLASLLSRDSVRTELLAVGMPASDFDVALPADERVRRALPHLAQMRNTAAYWCLFRIFRDLHDFHDPVLTPENYRPLFDRVATSASDPNWASTVLRDNCNIRTVVTSLANKSEVESRNPDSFRFMVDLDYLFCPGIAADLAPHFTGRSRKEEYVDALTAILGETPATPQRLERDLKDWLDRTVKGNVRFSKTFLPIEQRLFPPDDMSVATTLNHRVEGHEPEETEIDDLVRFVSWKILEWHHENRKTLRIAVGTERLDRGGKSIPRFQHNWAGDIARALDHFGNARFDLLVASDVLAQEVTVMAANFPNISLSGYWGHNFFPPLIEKNVAFRLQMVPMSKWTGFVSDADQVEWTYGKFQVVKKAMARAFASLIEAGYYEEDEVPPILQRILHDTPMNLFELG